MPSQNIGFRVFREIPRPDPALVAALGALESPYLSDAMNRFGGMIDDIRPAGPGMRLAGPAVTVRVPPGDNLMVYAAFEIARPGDIIVIEARGYTSVAQWGDLTSLIAKGLNLGGCVTDGSLRDLPGIREAGFPVFAKPVIVPNGSLKDGPGEVNVPVAVGDAHGVVVVPRVDAAVVLEKARAVAAGEVKKMKEFDQGAFLPDWLEATLRQKGCERIDG